MGESASTKNFPHIAICPSAGIGHLVPFLRLASMLSSSECKVTLVTIQPTLSIAETNQISTFLSSHPHVNSLDIPLQCQPPLISTNANNASTTTSKGSGPDPFMLRYDAVSRSAHLLTHHLSTLSPPPSAVFSDIMLVSGFNQALADLGIPNYVLITTSTRFFSLTTYLLLEGATQDGTMPKLELNNSIDEEVEIPPGLATVPKSSIPPPFFNPNHIFTKMLASNSLALYKVNGIVFNSFNSFEFETISALQERKVLSNLPPIFPIGPLKPFVNEKQGVYPYTKWLDEQPDKSVLYISFGSRTAMNQEQIQELGVGLEKSGVRFLWVIKTTTVDKDEKVDSVDELLGEGFLDRTKERGLVVKEWVDQEVILDHPAVGGFVTQCGWNSVMEAAQRGMPVLAWPQHGDQKVNAWVIQKAGLGVWEKEWGWVGQKLVKAEVIADKIKEVMNSEELRRTASKVGEEAGKTWDANNGGSSNRMLNNLISSIESGTNLKS